MSNIPNLGDYGYVPPIAQNMNVKTTGLPSDFWRNLLLFFLIATFVFCIVWLARSYMGRNRDKIN